MRIDNGRSLTAVLALALSLTACGDALNDIRGADHRHGHGAVGRHRVPRGGVETALDAASQGINEAPGDVAQAIHGQAPGDWGQWHGTRLDESNIWSQFDEARVDMAANERFIQVLKVRNDPRLGAYFSPASDGEYRGASRFGGPGADGATAWSRLNRTTRASRTFRQPYVTWTENRLIMAEARLAVGQPEAALTAVNEVRAAIGLPALPGPVTLEQVMVEKWIAQFQNIDAYSDWRRTCYPRLLPAGPSQALPAASIPFRYPYAISERLQNPGNIPPPSLAPATNWAHQNVTCAAGGGTI
jgi:hypothetical protein